jgi:sarcosine oxidase, subunit gamma
MADVMTLDRRYPHIPDVCRDGLLLRHVPAMTLVKLHAPGAAATALADELGAALPNPGCWINLGGAALSWTAPGEFLLAGPEAAAAPFVERIQKALQAHHALVAELSHARAVFQLAGGRARDALAAHCPLDLSDAQLPVGGVAGSLIGDAGAIIGRNTDLDGASNFTIIVDQTMAVYVARLLAGA